MQMSAAKINKTNEESTSMVWPTLGSRTATEQNRTLTMWWRDATNLAVQCRERAWFAINDRQTVSVKVNFSELVNTVQRTASWHRDLHIQHTVNEDYDPGIPDAFSIQRSLHCALHNPGICGSGLKNRSEITWTAQKCHHTSWMKTAISGYQTHLQ